ncbi:hypothetical protein B0H14DRAFT_2158408, partial [Mycena olivaceomarginata]
SDDIFDEKAVMLDEDREVFTEETKGISGTLGKIRTVCNKIINSPTKLLPCWRKVVKANRLALHVLPHDVKTRWNSTYNMINAALAYRRAIHEFTLDE